MLLGMVHFEFSVFFFLSKNVLSILAGLAFRCLAEGVGGERINSKSEEPPGKNPLGRCPVQTTPALPEMNHYWAMGCP